MLSDRELIQQALDALDRVMSHGSAVQEAKNILRERLAQPEQELVIDCPRCGHCCPRSKPLTDEEIDALPLPPSGTATVRDLVRIIEAAHGIKGEA